MLSVSSRAKHGQANQKVAQWLTGFGRNAEDTRSNRFRGWFEIGLPSFLIQCAHWVQKEKDENGRRYNKRGYLITIPQDTAIESETEAPVRVSRTLEQCSGELVSRRSPRCSFVPTVAAARQVTSARRSLSRHHTWTPARVSAYNTCMKPETIAIYFFYAPPRRSICATRGRLFLCNTTFPPDLPPTHHLHLHLHLHSRRQTVSTASPIRNCTCILGDLADMADLAHTPVSKLPLCSACETCK